MDKTDLGIYLHIPFCKHKCTYCAFASYQGLEDYYERYVDNLCREIDLWCERFPESRKKPVRTIYFGGGTPTELSNEQLERIMMSLEASFSLQTTQVSIESNPGEIAVPYLQNLRQIGFNRISFGVQTLRDDLLTLLGRTHSVQQAEQVINEAFRVGFHDISVDFMYGLPGQEVGDILHMVKRIKALPVNHVSVYGLQLEEHTYLEKQVKQGWVQLPSEDDTDLMHDTLFSAMESSGFERYEISAFTKDGAYSEHNLRYWNYGDYLGFGSGAHSFYQGVRRAKIDYVVPYCQAIEKGQIPYSEETIISSERAREDFSFLALRTKWGISEHEFALRFGASLDSVYGEVLRELTDKKLLYFYAGDCSWRLTSRGKKYGNYVFAKFLR